MARHSAEQAAQLKDSKEQLRVEKDREIELLVQQRASLLKVKEEQDAKAK